MAAESVSISATYGDNKTLDTLADLIAKRAERLNQTTEQATVATAINVLKSLRARTRVADPKEKAYIRIAKRPDLVPSFARYGARDLHSSFAEDEINTIHVVRVGGKKGPQYDGVWYDATGGWYANGVACYFVHDAVSKEAIGIYKRKYVLIANSESDARKWAETKHYRRVAAYAGTAKKLLGVAMNRVSEGSANDTAASGLIKSVLGKACFVSTFSEGVSSGKYSVLIQDLLRYAVPALEGGSSTVETALQKASNLTAKLINQHAAKSFDKEIDIPFKTITQGNT